MKMSKFLKTRVDLDLAFLKMIFGLIDEKIIIKILRKM